MPSWNDIGQDFKRQISMAAFSVKIKQQQQQNKQTQSQIHTHINREQNK